MNKQELIDKVSTETKLTKADCQRVIEHTLQITKDCVRNGEEVRLVGFGTFARSKRQERRGRNPQNGATIQIKAHWVARFRPGKEFRQFVH